jgi:hypothetical protein
MAKREVDSIAWADMQPHLMDTTTQGPGVAEIAQASRFQPRQDSGFGLGIAEIAQPIGEGLGLPEAIHSWSVSFEIQLVK